MGQIGNMKKIKGFALLILATGLIIPLTVINRHYVDKKYGNTDGYWQSTAKNIDIWANKEFRATWNAWLVQAIEVAGVIIYPYKFGVDGETISSALGKNQLLATLTAEGKKLVKILNRLEKDHCILWIDYELGEWIDPRIKKEGILKHL